MVEEPVLSSTIVDKYHDDEGEAMREEEKNGESKGEEGGKGRKE